MEATAGWAIDFIRKIVARAPLRPPASPGELVAQQMVEDELKAIGLQTSWHRFRFHRSIYGNFALHFGLAVAATAVSPWCPMGAAVVHALVAFSYAMQSTRRHSVLSRLYFRRPSQNLLAVMPAEGGGQPSLRLVFMGHADAAFNGLVFNPAFVRSTMNSKGPFRRSIALATWATAAMVAFDLLRVFADPLPYVRFVEWAVTAPAIIAFLLNFDVYVRNRHVQGANDNLTAAAAMPVLAARLGPERPPDVELVFALTGCEEAGLGGAMALQREVRSRWDRKNTVFINMDGLSNGQLRYIDPEGELFLLRPDRWLVDLVDEVRGSRPGFAPFADVAPFDITIGGTDMAAFQTAGWQGISFVAIDPATGSPRHYHTTRDTVDNLDLEEYEVSLDFISELARRVMKRGSSAVKNEETAADPRPSPIS